MRNAWLHQRTNKELRGQSKVNQLTVNKGNTGPTVWNTLQRTRAKSVQVCGHLTPGWHWIDFAFVLHLFYITYKVCTFVFCLSTCLYAYKCTCLHSRRFKFLLTSTLSSADQRRSSWSSSPLSRSGEENADTVLSVWFQMPNFVGERADAVSLWPRRMAGSVHYLPTNHRPITYYGVCVQLNDQVSGAWPQQLRWGYRGGWD